MAGTTVVLGWDALDYEVAETFDFTDSFGQHARRIDTFANPVVGEPHTRELWPSIITGLRPDEHGVHAISEGSPGWENPIIESASRLAQDVLPARIRTEIGRFLRDQSASFEHVTADYYREEGIPTIFDGRAARAITVPNYQVSADEQAGYLLDRAAQLNEFLGVREETNEPLVGLSTLDERLIAEASKKVGAVRAALRREYDLVFVWLSYLDTVGHLAPVVAEEEPGWQERAYRLAAAMTDEVQRELTDDDTLVCVSDHGLQDGDHTHDAFVGASDEAGIEGVESVLDIADAIDRITPASGDIGEPGVRDPYRYETHTSTRDADELREQLEDLGYL